LSATKAVIVRVGETYLGFTSSSKQHIKAQEMAAWHWSGIAPLVRACL